MAELSVLRDEIQSYAFPGNVRELENPIKRIAVIVARAGVSPAAPARRITLRPMNPWKLRVARAFDRSGLSRALLAGQRIARSPYIRILNYHDVPPAGASAFERQLAFFARHFEPVGLAELEGFFAGRWTPRRPGLILSFDDGLRSHAEVAAPRLERAGFPGWFCVPAGLPNLPVADPEAFKREHCLRYDERAFPDRRGILSWEEVRRLDKNHVIVCHSYTHRRLPADLSPADYEREVVLAKAVLERELGHPVRAFAWVGGEEWAYSAAAAAAIRRAGYEFGLMTNHAVIRRWTDPLRLQRTNVEACDPPELVSLSLSGAFDALYWAKRRRVNRITAAPPRSAT